MKIAVIGAGISGLIAARELSKAGHEVHVYEKSQGYGGRLSTRYHGDKLEFKTDHGLGYLTGESPLFNQFLKELLEIGIIKPWTGNFCLHMDGAVRNWNPNPPLFIAPEGINRVGSYLARTVDVVNDKRVGGLTYIGNKQKKKKAWMLNFDSSETVQADAVIIATPAPQAYAILNTTIDEIEALKAISLIDEVRYESKFSLMAGYETEVMPDWDLFESIGSPVISVISNEAKKRGNTDACFFSIHSTGSFARQHEKTDRLAIAEMMLKACAEFTGEWIRKPAWQQMHYWRFARPLNSIPHPYLDVSKNEGNLAIVGGYFSSGSVESAYISGYELAQRWIEKFS